MSTPKFAKTLLIVFSLILLLVAQSCKTNTGDPDPEPEPETENPYNISVTEIAAIDPGESTTITGDISSGIIIDELDWAAFSNVACFPATRFVEYQGNQLFYEVDIPQGSELVVRLNSIGEPRKRINLYGYIDFKGNNLPPIQSVRSCEAGYPLYVGTPDLSDPGDTRQISFAQAVNNPFTALIVVSGAQGITSGEFEMIVELQ
ncbi:MAG: hypothetical protein AAF587_30550 [Bacteroidota bacterium]